jgi:formyl-CoA transferase/CoA:oxalate CoA-transferase
MDLTGEVDGPPTKSGISVADEVAGLYLVQGILTALLRRTRTGAGELVEVALHDAMLSMLTYQAQGYLAAGAAPRRMGSAHPSLVPYRPFATSDGSIVVGITGEPAWAAFCAAAGLEGLVDDPRFASNAARVENRDLLEPLIAERMASRESDHWLGVLGAAGVVCGRVRTVAEALDGPEAAAREMVVTLPNGGMRMLGLPIAIAGAPVLRWPPPSHGEHTVSLLEELGYDALDIGRLRDQGVV